MQQSERELHRFQQQQEQEQEQGRNKKLGETLICSQLQQLKERMKKLKDLLSAARSGDSSSAEQRSKRQHTCPDEHSKNREDYGA